MKVIKLSHDNYFDIERILRKVAEENGIKEIKRVEAKLSKEEGFVKFAIIDDWADYDEDFGTEPIDSETGTEDDAVSTGPRYTIYYKDFIKMNGEGISHIIDKEDGDKWPPDRGLEVIIDDLSETHPEYHDYEIGPYISGDMAGYGMHIDYEVDAVPDDVVDKIDDWFWRNVSFEKIGGEE